MMNHPAREKQVIVQTNAGGEEVLTEVDVRLISLSFYRCFSTWMSLRGSDHFNPIFTQTFSPTFELGGNWSLIMHQHLPSGRRREKGN